MLTGIGVVCAMLCSGQVSVDAAIGQLDEHLGDLPALVMVVSSGDAEDQAAVTRLVEQKPWTIIVQGKGAGLRSLRTWARTEQMLGSRVTVIDADPQQLWLASDTADAVWVLSSVTGKPPRDETMRVLRAGGVLIGDGPRSVKPATPGTDQWRHPYHGPDNNVVSQDSIARLPGELRFQTEPMFAAMPNQSLFAGGRIFFFTGHIAFHEREEPLLNRLTVLNAYNGLTLWSRPLDPRFVVHNFSKVATDDQIIYAEGGSLLVLNAADGRELGKYDVPAEAAAGGDTDWKWLAQEDGILWAALGPPDGRVAPHRQKRQMGHWPWDVANAQYRVIVENFGDARTLAAFSFPEMKKLWSIRESEPFDVRAMCIDGGKILQLAPQKYIAAREAATGKQLWRHTPATSSSALSAIGTALRRQGWGLGWATFCCARAHDGVVCIAGPPFKKSVCVNLQDGELLWSTDNESPHPFFLDSSLYVMPRVANPSALCRRVDPESGKVLDEFNLGVIGSCTRLTVTPTQFYYRPGGGEGRTVYFDITARELASYEGVVRPGCFDGAVPANGRLYWMPLACDCWQVHGTFSMAPRAPLPEFRGFASTADWEEPTGTTPAGTADWPAFRANSRGTATVPGKVLRRVDVSWQRQLPVNDLTAPIAVGDGVYVGSADGTVTRFDLSDGRQNWVANSRAALVHPPAYWKGRIVFGSCDGFLYSVDAATGRRLGAIQVAPETRFVNIMNRFLSVWPLGGGVVIRDDGTAFAAAGSTATDGTVIIAVDVATGTVKWRQAYTLDRKAPPLSFGVQANVLLSGDKLLINGGAPVGIVALDQATGAGAEVVARLDAGSEMFLEPEPKPVGTPFCTGPELYCREWARTTIFKRHQGRAYFQVGDRHVALVAGRLFCAADTVTLDAIVKKMNSDPISGGNRVTSEPWDVMKVPLPDNVLWSGKSDDVCGLAAASDGLVVLHPDKLEALDTEGNSRWRVELPAPPVRWGLALAQGRCIVTLTDGRVLALGPAESSE